MRMNIFSSAERKLIGCELHIEHIDCSEPNDIAIQNLKANAHISVCI